MNDGSAIISFNATNWITVLLMVAIGFAVFGFIAKLYQQKQSQKAS